MLEYKEKGVKQSMNIFIIGGTGLLGSVAAKELIKRGHSVKTLALPGLPQGADIPKEMEIHFGNYFEMSDSEMLEFMDGVECFIFAAGVDERVEFPAPIYPMYEKYNIEPIRRLFTLAKKAGVKQCIVYGSYFTYLNRIRPEMGLTEKHPYIKSRAEQQKAALSFADEDMTVSVLELPYIFGSQKGRKPVWVIFVEKLQSMGPVTFWPKGGTAAVSTRQVGEAVAGIVEKNVTGIYPIATKNYTWKELMLKIHEGMGKPRRRFYHIPEKAFRAYAHFLQSSAEKKGFEPGLNYVELSAIMCTQLFMETGVSKSLGVTPDDVDSAIIDSIRASVDAITNEGNYIGMKAE
ncbi:MAG: NAD-dependent epimerase/dehydratase family protein [Acutalibacteraceae bacterium]